MKSFPPKKLLPKTPASPNRSLSKNSRVGRRKSYEPKHQPPSAPHHFLLGVRQAAGLSRSIFPGAVKRTISIHSAPRAQKGYSRISLTRFASCIAPTSPAIAAAQRVRSARAPEVGRTANRRKRTSRPTHLQENRNRQNLTKNIITKNLLSKIPASEHFNSCNCRIVPTYFCEKRSFCRKPIQPNTGF